MADLVRESWAWGLPQAAIALLLAGALGIATLLVLDKRGPKNRLASDGPAYAWAWLYVAVGMAAWLLAGYAWLNANPSSTMGFAVVIGTFVAILVTPVWYGQLTGLGVAASRLGTRSMHLLMAAMTLAGVAAAAATPPACGLLLESGVMSDDGAVLPVIVGIIPLGSALAALCLAPMLPVGRYGKGRCMRCGYDLAGLPESSKTNGAIRCPECGYHPSATEPPTG
ncbi:MAG: hypothetical protein RIE77_01990 [Phycisphaerales bacterium]